MYCSRPCKTKAARERPVNATKNKVRYLMWQYGLDQADAERALVEGRKMERSSGVAHCVVCGKEFIAKRVKTRKYCSYQCANAAVRLGLRPPSPKKPPPDPTPLRCVECGEMFLPVRYTAGRNKYCGPGCKSRARHQTPAFKADALRRYYQSKYGLTLVEVEEMRSHGCAICGRTEGNGRFGQLHIDHCHDTGKVRGVLCHSCNVSLGHFNHDPDLLRKAAAYLE